MLLSYTDTIHYLYDKLPMFQRIGNAAIKKDLTNTLELCNWLGNPHEKFKSIHIAGTNGKGSTAHMLAAALQQAGFKTGLYTSPHLKDFRERILINGEMITEQEVVRFVDKTKKRIEDIKPSFFEVTVAMAFEYFARQGVDIAIIETGLGGRLDSTNIITPILSIITNISYDHQYLLGNTLEEIAAEKAGIIKPGIPVIIGRKQDETEKIFAQTAITNQAAIYFSENLSQENITTTDRYLCADFRLKDGRDKRVCTDLPAIYQQENLRTVVAALDLLYYQQILLFDLDKALDGIAHTRLLTKFSGRWQVISEDPLILADGAHNPDGITRLMAQVARQPYNKLHIVLGMVKDKDVTGVLSLFPATASYYFTQPDLPRALAADDLKNIAQEYGLQGDTFIKSKHALQSASTAAAVNDLILVTGSLFLVGELV